jgi:hypothetical protein
MFCRSVKDGNGRKGQGVQALQSWLQAEGACVCCNVMAGYSERCLCSQAWQCLVVEL